MVSSAELPSNSSGRVINAPARDIYPRVAASVTHGPAVRSPAAAPSEGYAQPSQIHMAPVAVRESEGGGASVVARTSRGRVVKLQAWARNQLRADGRTVNRDGRRQMFSVLLLCRGECASGHPFRSGSGREQLHHGQPGAGTR